MTVHCEGPKVFSILPHVWDKKGVDANCTYRRESHTDWHRWMGPGGHHKNPIRTTNLEISMVTMGAGTEFYLIFFITNNSCGSRNM